MHPYARILQDYMTALDQSNYTAIKNLFTPDARVKSPFLGDVPADHFFDRLAATTAKNAITPIDIFLSATENHHATAYFQYEWLVKEGTFITFKVMDLFTFDQKNNKISFLDLIYDTHPIRISTRVKYDL